MDITGHFVDNEWVMLSKILRFLYVPCPHTSEIYLVVENKRDSQYKTLPNPSEWENARVICDKLEVFYEVTAIFSRTRYLTANLYFTKISEIRLKFSEWLLSPNKVVSNMASQMIEKFDEYWGDIHELMGVAVVFDPRNKME
ncbi:zinc finger BED domain-containing protein RICESLEEPER 2-like protein [Tanacetum coccineum]